MPSSIAPDRLEIVLRFAVCPGCRGPLQRARTALTCAACGRSFPLVAGRPVFLPDPASVKVMPASHLSNQPPDNVAAWLRGLDGWALNMGAGGTVEKIPNVIELEHALFRHTDVSADAHCLPFRDACFDAVVTFNTFEHLYDPVQAAREIERVLKPGGRLFLHTAFLQPVHEPPHHYYNGTEYGVRRWFKSFDIKNLGVSANFNPAFVLAWLSCEMLDAVKHYLGPEAHRRLAQSTLESWSQGWPDATRRGALWDMLGSLPQAVQARFAAGFELDAVKGPRSIAAPAAWPDIAPSRHRPGHWLRHLAKRILLGRAGSGSDRSSGFTPPGAHAPGSSSSVT
jgi:SAM-dependent methyltransferase